MNHTIEGVFHGKDGYARAIAWAERQPGKRRRFWKKTGWRTITEPFGLSIASVTYELINPRVVHFE